jgi:PST family polysaccharide transporter
MSLANQAMRGAFWNVAMSLVGRALSMVGTVMVTRYLAPEVIGEVQVATVLVISVHQLSLMGLGLNVVARPREGRDMILHVTLASLVPGVLLLGGMVLLRDRLALAFDAPAVVAYLPGMALAIVLDRVSLCPQWVLARDLRFKALGVMTATGDLIYPFVAVGLAAAGWGGHAIVVANVARVVARLCVLLPASGLGGWIGRFRPSWSRLRDVFRFGLPNGVADVARYASKNWDNLLVARLFGPAELGHYQLAYNLADVPSTHVGEQVSGVLLPSFARVSPERRREALARALRLMAMVMFPMTIGLAALSSSLVEAFLPPVWAPVGPRLAILALFATTMPLSSTLGSYLQATDRAGTVMWMSLLRVGLVLGLMAVAGLVGGALRACAGAGLAFVIYSGLLLTFAARGDGVPARALAAHLAAPLLCCVPLAGAVVGIRAALDAAGLGVPLLSVVAELVAGAVAYAAAIRLFAPALLRELLTSVRRALPSRQERRDAAGPDQGARDVSAS